MVCGIYWRIGMIVLPWPDKRLFPNFKRANHWRKYRDAERDARALGWGLTNEALSWEDRARIAQGDDKIAFQVRFYPPDRRYRDDDGMIGALKNYRDGVADALGVDDRRFRPSYSFEEPDKPGRVEIDL
jgi:crossover junction endodeoxyribonuclease RusA